MFLRNLVRLSSGQSPQEVLKVETEPLPSVHNQRSPWRSVTSVYFCCSRHKGTKLRLRSNENFNCLFTGRYRVTHHASRSNHRVITKLHGVIVPHYRVITDSLGKCTAICAAYSKVPSSILCQEAGYSISQSLLIKRGHAVKTLCYKLEGRGFETRWGEWIFFFNLPNPFGRTRPWGLLSL
jgi:hypothetical protein